MKHEKRVWMTLGRIVGLMLGLAAFTEIGLAKDLAEVNGRKITSQDLQNALMNFTPAQRAAILEDNDSRMQMLDQLVSQELLVQDAGKKGLQNSPQFRQAVQQFQRQYLAEMIIEQQIGPKATEKEAENFYKTHPLLFSTDQVHAMHILSKTEKEANDLLRRVKAGEDFQRLAERSSIDPSAKNNRGDLGFFTRDRMIAEFSEAAFEGDKGEIIGPVKTAYGYHIIRVVDKKPGQILSFDDVKVQAQAALRNRLIQDYVTKLKDEAKVKVNP
jgi:peptidyl-prolyl cis-trans isomerase C